MKLSFSSLLSLGFESSRIKFSWNLSRLFHCSVIKELMFAALCDSSLIISEPRQLVKNFFDFLNPVPDGFLRSDSLYIITKLSTFVNNFYYVFHRFSANLLLFCGASSYVINSFLSCQYPISSLAEQDLKQTYIILRFSDQQVFTPSLLRRRCHPPYFSQDKNTG